MNAPPFYVADSSKMVPDCLKIRRIHCLVEKQLFLYVVLLCLASSGVVLCCLVFHGLLSSCDLFCVVRPCLVMCCVLLHTNPLHFTSFAMTHFSHTSVSGLS